MSLSYAILGFLHAQPMTGYDLQKTFDQSIHHFWASSLSQIYRELGALEHKGCLNSRIETQPDRPDKKIYHITDAGKEEFRKWITHFPENLSKETRDEFLLRICFGSHVDREEWVGQFRRFIAEKKSELDQVNQLLAVVDTVLKKMHFPSEDTLYWGFVLRRAQMTLEVSIRWAEECAGTLNKKEK